MTFATLKTGEAQALESSTTEEVGIGGFKLFATVSDSTDYTTQAPTAVVEDGSYVGDHLINAPIQISISGEVADIFIPDTPRSQSESRLPTVGKVTAFLPGRTPSQIQRVAKIIDSAADRFKGISNNVMNGRNTSQLSGNMASGKPYREQFIDFIETLHYGKQLVSISTAFRTHDSMAITSVTVTRDNQRKVIAFSLTASKFRIAKTLFADVSRFYKKPAPSVKSQATGTADKGTQSPTSGATSGAGNKKEKSVLSAVLGR